MKKVFTLVTTLALLLVFSVAAMAVTEVVLQGEDVYSGNINNGSDNGGTADDNAADLQPGEKLSFTLPADLTEGEYKVELRTTGNRTDYNVYVGDTQVATVKRPEGSGWGFDYMTTDAANANVALKAGDVLVIEAPDNGEYGWVDWVTLTLVKAAGGSGDETPTTDSTSVENPKTGDPTFIGLTLCLLCVSLVACLLLTHKTKRKGQ